MPADEDAGIGERDGEGGRVDEGDVCRGGGVVDNAVIEILRKSILWFWARAILGASNFNFKKVAPNLEKKPLPLYTCFLYE